MIHLSYSLDYLCSLVIGRPVQQLTSQQPEPLLLTSIQLYRPTSVYFQTWYANYCKQIKCTSFLNSKYLEVNKYVKMNESNTYSCYQCPSRPCNQQLSTCLWRRSLSSESPNDNWSSRVECWNLTTQRHVICIHCHYHCTALFMIAMTIILTITACQTRPLSEWIVS